MTPAPCPFGIFSCQCPQCQNLLMTAKSRQNCSSNCYPTVSRQRVDWFHATGSSIVWHKALHEQECWLAMTSRSVSLWGSGSGGNTSSNGGAFFAGGRLCRLNMSTRTPTHHHTAHILLPSSPSGTSHTSHTLPYPPIPSHTLPMPVHATRHADTSKPPQSYL